LIPIEKGEPEQVRQALVVERNPKKPGVRDEEKQPNQAHEEPFQNDLSMPIRQLSYSTPSVAMARRARRAGPAGLGVLEHDGDGSALPRLVQNANLSLDIWSPPMPVRDYVVAAWEIPDDELSFPRHKPNRCWSNFQTYAIGFRD
jgi:hypothetical protein